MKRTAIYKTVMFIEISVWWFSKECWSTCHFYCETWALSNKNYLFFVK